MSYARVEDDKDIIIFKTSDNIDSNSSQKLDESAESSSNRTASSTEPQEAYNPETGEINWDCPCIAPMVQPPCGDYFKEAFSCFVYSKSEPKGQECVDKFREMQHCFQANPDIYGEPDAGPADDAKHAESNDNSLNVSNKD